MEIDFDTTKDLRGQIISLRRKHDGTEINVTIDQIIDAIEFIDRTILQTKSLDELKTWIQGEEFLEGLYGDIIIDKVFLSVYQDERFEINFVLLLFLRICFSLNSSDNQDPHVVSDEVNNAEELNQNDRSNENDGGDAQKPQARTSVKPMLEVCLCCKAPLSDATPVRFASSQLLCQNCFNYRHGI